MKRLVDKIDEEVDKFNLTKELIKRQSGTTPPVYIPTPSMSPTNITLGGLRDYDAEIQQSEVRLREWFENRFREPYEEIQNAVNELYQRQQQTQSQPQTQQPQTQQPPQPPQPPQQTPSQQTQTMDYRPFTEIIQTPRQPQQPTEEVEDEDELLRMRLGALRPPRNIEPLRRPELRPSQSQEYSPPIAQEEDDFSDLLAQLMPLPSQQTETMDYRPFTEILQTPRQPITPPLFSGLDEPDEPPLFDPRRPPEQPQISPMLNLAEPTPSSQIPIYDFGDDYEIIERDVPSVPVGEELEKKKSEEQKKVMEDIAGSIEYFTQPLIESRSEESQPAEIAEPPPLQLQQGEEEYEDEEPLELVYEDLEVLGQMRRPSPEDDDKYAVERIRDDLRDTYGIPEHIISEPKGRTAQNIAKLIERASNRSENPLSQQQNQQLIDTAINDTMKEVGKGQTPNKDTLPKKLFLQNLQKAYEQQIIGTTTFGVGEFANITQDYQLLPALAEEYGTAGEEIKKPSPRTEQSLEELMKIEEDRRFNEQRIFEGIKNIEDNKNRIELLKKDKLNEEQLVEQLKEDREEIQSIIDNTIQFNLVKINEEMEEKLMRGTMVEDVEEQMKYEDEYNKLEQQLAYYGNMLKELEQQLSDIDSDLELQSNIDKINAEIQVLELENKGFDEAIEEIRKNMN